jgi:hypothetical protein
MPKISGRCLCGAVSYHADAEPVATALCHCEDCQRQSGSPFSLNVVVPRDAFVVEGEMASYETIGTESGKPRQRRFCAGCGSPIVTEISEMPDVVVIKAGTLDDRSWLEPQLEVWSRSKQPWVDGGAGRHSLPTGLQG